MSSPRFVSIRSPTTSSKPVRHLPTNAGGNTGSIRREVTTSTRLPATKTWAPAYKTRDLFLGARNRPGYRAVSGTATPKSIIYMDPPDHRAMRSLLKQGFHATGDPGPEANQ